MAEYFALQAAFFFATSHILIRRGLVTSNAVTGSFVSLGMTALILATAAYFTTPAGAFWQAAVFLLGENWKPQNFLGTVLVIAGIAILSASRGGKSEWRRADIVFPVVAALAFGISTNLRKVGLTAINRPFMAAAFTAATAFLFSASLLASQGGTKALKLKRSNAPWFFAAGLANTSATLSVFHALSYGDVVVVEPLTSSNPVFSLVMSALFLRDLESITRRVVLGALCTVIGTILVVTR